MRRLFILILSLILASAMAMTSFAADLNISCDKDIKAGDTFELIVEYSDENLDLVRGTIEYDDEMLQYVSGGSSEGSGGIVAIDSHSEDGSKVAEVILFEALKDGQTNVKVTTEECYDLDGNMLNNPWSENKIIISKADAEKDKEKADAEAKAKEKAEAEAEAKAQAEAEKEAYEKAQLEQQKVKNNMIQIIFIAITAVLLVVALIIRSKKRKKNN